MSHTLVLNGDFQAITVVSWRRAVQLIIAEKAEVLEEGDDYLHSERMIIGRPTVIRLLRYVKLPFRRRVPVTRKNVLVRDKYVCGYCRGRADTVDHVRPKAQGGTHTWRNVVAACKACNGKKRDRTPVEAGMPLLLKPFEPEGKVAFLVVVDVATDSTWEPYLSLT